MARLIFHIGPHKTGTTYLQNSLTEARAVLASHGVGYLESEPNSTEFAPHKLVEDVSRGKLSVPGFAARIAEMAERYSTVVISSENLSLLPSSFWQGVEDCLSPDNELVVACYLRSRSAAIYSAWQETIKHGEIRTLPEHLGFVLLQPFQNPQINIQFVLTNLTDALRKNLKLVVYDNVIAQGRDLTDHFVEEIIGIRTGAPIGLRIEINRSFPPSWVEVMRRLNMISIEKGFPRNHMFRTTLLKAVKEHPHLRDEFGSLQQAVAAKSIEFDLSGIDRNFVFLDRQLADTYRHAIVNPISTEPFTLMERQAKSMFTAFDQANTSILDLWARFWQLHDSISGSILTP